jgi:hypothetical protein
MKFTGIGNFFSPKSSRTNWKKSGEERERSAMAESSDEINMQRDRLWMERTVAEDDKHENDVT